jgi:xanthine dehydrogenase YagS FAD-binding subunit
MNPFAYVKADSDEAACNAGLEAGAQFIAGGTVLVDLLRLGVITPNKLIDITGLDWNKIEPTEAGLRIGALVRNSDLAYDDAVVRDYPALSQALLSGASPQLRNMATLGGNLLQRTRCAYFRDPTTIACNKRTPGSGCAALQGFARMHAVLGGSDQCIAVQPSDMCVALLALDAVVHTRGAHGSRAIALGEFHTLPGDHPEIESVLEHGELVTHVTLPKPKFAARSVYVKTRDRASYAFALASAAVALELEGGVVRSARVALGGIATKPWRSVEAERVLVGQRADDAHFTQAAQAALVAARPVGDNAFKIELARRTIVRALKLVRGLA